MHFDDVPRELLVVVAAVALLFAVVTTARGWVVAARRRRRFARAAAGESEAVALLEAEGFVIEGAQVTGTYTLQVDESPVAIRVRADYIVSCGNDHFVAEVKTGRLAPNIETAATRRQLLEYEHAFDVAGVLLVDADARTVRRVEFSRAFGTRRADGERRWGRWVLAAIAIAALAIARLSR